MLDEWPVERPANWLELVNDALPEPALVALRTSVNRGRPFGSQGWVKGMCKLLGLEFTLRPRGRPPRADDAGEQV